MSYTLIKGEFHIHYPDIPRNGPEPDGDTLKFLPDDRQLINGLVGDRSPAFNGRGMINIRFEGIDALETHFQEMHQNMTLAEKARDRLLKLTGFGDIKFFDDLPEKVEAVQNHPIQGYVLARSIDGNGRVIAFVYNGTTGRSDGTSVFLQGGEMSQSLNARLISEGLAYPSYYSSLPLSLSQRLTQLTYNAWYAGRGIWPEDTANVDYWQEIRDLDALQTMVIWPKLFRRLARYFAEGNAGLSGFDTWLRSDPWDRDDRVMLPTGELGNIHDTIEMNANWIHMIYWPEEIVILPDGV